MNLRGVMLATAFGLITAAAGADGTPTIDFFKHPQYGNIKISPKGDYLAVTVPEERRARLAIIKLSNMSVSTVFDIPDGQYAYDYFWLNDHRVVFDSTKRVPVLSGALEQPRLSGIIYAGNVDGSHGIALGNVDDFHDIASDKGPYFLWESIPHSDNSVLFGKYDQEDYTSGSIRYYRMSINRLNVDSLHIEQIAAPPYRSFNFLSDADGQVRYMVAEDENDHLITLYRDSNNDAWTTLSTEPALGEHTQPLGFSADKSHVFLGNGQGVFLVDLKTKERKLVSHAIDVTERHTIMATDMHTPIGVAVDTDYPTIELFDPVAPESQLIRTLQKTFEGSRISPTSLTSDGKLGVVKVSSDVNPGEFFLVNLKDNSVSPLLKTMPWIDPAKMTPMEAIKVTARDGTVLHGYLTVPRGAPEHGLPMVVLVHGGPHGIRDLWGFDPEVQFLASHGYAVLQINYRGSSGYGHAFESAGYKHWGTTMQNDVTDATLWAIKDGVADPKRICIAGGSYGGYSAMMGVIREPDLYRCAFGYDGVYDLEMMFKNGDIQESMEGLNYLTDVLGTDSADLHNRSPVNNVEKIKVPLFLAHGEADERAPFAQFRALTAALDKAGKPYEKLVKSQEEHGFYNEKNRAELYDRLAAFLDKNI
ncbi:MAG: S9 family peptidase, partial [Nevskia sp.]|nr:S9 family peptidase [Nevskia sp.]